MRHIVKTALVGALMSGPAFAGGHASGDAAAGEDAFKQCRACHSVINAEGEALIRGGKTGPNLWGLPGRTAGTDEEFTRYQDSIVAAGEAGLVWNEEEFVKYTADPGAYLKEYLDDGSARSGMSFKLRKEEDAVNIWAYLASVSPEPEEEPES